MQAPAKLNGLEPTALATAIATVAGDPSLAPATFSATTSWTGRFSSRTDVSSYELGGQRHERRHTIACDEPVELFGDNTAPNPQELLLAAVNACMMVGFVAGATARGIEIESLVIESGLGVDLRGAFGIDPNVKPGTDKIRYTVRVKANATKAELEEIHREMTEKSPNRFHMTSPIPMEASLVVL